MLYVAKFTLRLALGVSIAACLFLGAAKVGGVLFNHDHILVYVDFNDTQNPSYLTSYLLAVERHIVNRLAPRNVNNLVASDCSTDGRLALYDFNRGIDSAIYLKDNFEGNIVEVTNAPGEEVGARWSPDGQYLAYQSFRADGTDIYVTDVSSDASQRLTDEGINPGVPTWSPDGEQLLFASHNSISEIYTVTLDGYIQQLTRNYASKESPVWSPDGKSIAFSSDYDGDFDIYMMDSDGGNLRQLIHTDGDDKFPVWSPDGRSIVYIANCCYVYIADADGSNQHLLVDDRSFNSLPVWSRDAHYLALVQNFPNGEFFINVYFISTDRSNFSLHTRIKVPNGALPIWCP